MKGQNQAFGWVSTSGVHKLHLRVLSYITLQSILQMFTVIHASKLTLNWTLMIYREHKSKIIRSGIYFNQRNLRSWSTATESKAEITAAANVRKKNQYNSIQYLFAQWLLKTDWSLGTCVAASHIEAFVDPHNSHALEKVTILLRSKAA